LLELDLEIDVRARLGKIPEGLGKAYDEIFEQIRKKPGSEPRIAHRAFQWIMCSNEPLSPEKLIAAVCQDPENDSFTETYVTIDFVLKACHNLLVVDLEGICRFSHLSVQEYLEEIVWTTGQANSYVAKVCLVALNDSKVDQKRAGFEVRRWYPNRQKYELDELEPSSSASFAVCLFGIFELLSSWWEIGFANVEQKNRNGVPLLQLAARGGNFAVTKALIELGADVNAQGGEYGNALQAASIRGGSATVELLLSKGADVNAQGGPHGNALQAASYGGHSATVELLLSKGAIEKP